VLTVVFGMLFNVSGQLCSVLCVCGYCVLDEGFCSVIFGCLMDEWMNVFYAVYLCVCHLVYTLKNTLDYTSKLAHGLMKHFLICL
jgi:hypothetical protein